MITEKYLETIKKDFKLLINDAKFYKSGCGVTLSVKPEFFTLVRMYSMFRSLDSVDLMKDDFNNPTEIKGIIGELCILIFLSLFGKCVPQNSTFHSSDVKFVDLEIKFSYYSGGHLLVDEYQKYPDDKVILFVTSSYKKTYKDLYDFIIRGYITMGEIRKNSNKYDKLGKKYKIMQKDLHKMNTFDIEKVLTKFDTKDVLKVRDKLLNRTKYYYNLYGDDSLSIFKELNKDDEYVNKIINKGTPKAQISGQILEPLLSKDEINYLEKANA